MSNNADTCWTPGHFIGGDSGIDLVNTVFTRHKPDHDNDLFNSPRDVGNWLHFAGLATRVQANAVSSIPATGFLNSVRQLREASFSVFDALAAGKPPLTKGLGRLFELAANGLAEEGRLKLIERESAPQVLRFDDPEAIVAFLATISSKAYFVLPRGRLHACPRCGWLFVDTSRGGKRRWCSMQTCGNREKTSRHKEKIGWL
ncbi:CGNR zinc finger domain-containing protein [Ensifer sp.]|uniref:CGNR zinc finger domain-containing protein n=1 Tax=Ensifer sp. TaxID=1872086 RepID=UPI0028A1B96A|nr:CGNR zinc finger domain-containing protein [Ensifer sp.]